MHWLIDHSIGHFNITPEPASRASDIIAFVCEDIGESRDDAIYTIRPDGSDLSQILTQPRQAYSRISWSPNGIWLLMVVSYLNMPVDSDDKDEIFRVRFDGLAPKRLTYNRVNDRTPHWSSDGNSIWFFRYGSYGAIHNISLDGNEISQSYNRFIKRGDSIRAQVDLSPVGQNFIASDFYDGILYGTRLNGTDWRVLTNAGKRVETVAWAPNNKQIMYFTLGLYYDRQKLAIFNVKEQVEEFSIEMEWVWDAKWSPDSQWIALDGQALEDEDREYLFLLEVASGHIRNVVTMTDRYQIGGLSWSPDSEWIAYSASARSGGNSQLFKTKRDGTGLQQLANMDCWITEVSWSPK